MILVIAFVPLRLTLIFMATVSANILSSPEPIVSNDAAFSRELSKKFREFTSNGTKNLKGGLPLLMKSIFYLSFVIMIYTFLLSVELSILNVALVSCLLGVFVALSGINITHDGVHDTFSKKQWLNHSAAFVLNVLGASSYYWKTKHTISHHFYTNIHEKDADLEQGMLLRLHPSQKKRFIHRYQHIYFPFLYALSYIIWSLFLDPQKYFSSKTGDFEFTKMKAKDHIIFWLGKALTISIFMIAPVLAMGYLKAIILYLCFGVFCGLTLSLIFQLAHIIEGVSFQSIKGGKEENWFVHQIKTTANFSSKSKFIHFICGGLNFQIEHHLFPKVSHIHYPKLSKIVKETCDKFNIGYNNYPTFMDAMRSHVTQLKKLGTTIA